MSVYNEKYVKFDVKAKNKLDALSLISKFAKEVGVVDDEEGYYKGLLEREEEVTTGFGNGIAIPHARVKAVKKPSLLVMKLSEEVEWESLDDLPVDLILAIAMPADGHENSHLQLLAELSRNLMHQDFVNCIKSCQSAKEFIMYLKGEKG